MSQSTYCFGIDLGTSQSSICCAHPQGRHRLPYVHIEEVRLPKDKDEADLSARLPSVVYSKGRRILAGFQALDCWRKASLWSTIFPSAKSDLGTHRIYEDAQDRRLDSPVKVQAEILKQLIDGARKATGIDPRNANVVITVPASFEMAQRQDTLLAAQLAGLELKDGDLLDEPNAAFLDLVNSHTIDNLDLKNPKRILVYDFGGGTCDVSILRVSRDPTSDPLGLVVQNLSISNYERLGGDNIDLYLADELLIPAVCEKSGIVFPDLTERDKRELRWMLKETARRLKERLCDKARHLKGTARDKAAQAWSVDPFALVDSGSSTKKTNGELTFDEFRALLYPFLDSEEGVRLAMADGYYVGSLFTPVMTALGRAELTPDDIDVVLLNGGSCRNPLVREAFEESPRFAHIEVLEPSSLDLAVARGATFHAYYKHCLCKEVITPIVNAEIGLFTLGDHFETLVKAGTPLPFPGDAKFERYMERFWVPNDGLERVQFAVYAGTPKNHSLVQTMALQLPPGTRRQEQIVVELHIDQNKMMEFVAFLATHPQSHLKVRLENPLAMRLPTPEQKDALEFRKKLQEKRERHFPDLPTADEFTTLANLERLAGEAQRGLEILQRLAERTRSRGQNISASAHNIMGLCYDGLGRRDRAIEHYRQGSELAPTNEVYLSNYGYSLRENGRLNDAVPVLRRSVALNTKHGIGYAMLGDALRQLGREEEALVEYRQAKKVLEERVRLQPDDGYSLGWLIGVCHGLGQYDEAAQYQQRKNITRRTAVVGASPHELVAGLDSGIVKPGELRDAN